MKKLLMAVVILSVMLSLFASSVAETGTAEKANDAVVVQVAADDVHTATFTHGTAEDYINKLLYPTTPRPGIKKAPRPVGTRLSGSDAIVYQQLAEQVSLVASGQRASTIFAFPVEDVYEKIEFTAEDLGVPAICVDGVLQDDAKAALSSILTSVDISVIFDALRQDMPYEMYWADVEYGWSFPGFSYWSDGSSAFFAGDLEIMITVGQEYRDSTATDPDYTIDTSWGQRATAAAENANAIVNAYAGYSDYAALLAFKNEICSRVSYNSSAADDSTNTPYGNPWQLIWVFDDDDETNVVCEGYAKAFKYMVDRSNISATCHTASGVMSGGTGAGNHMWNVVTLDGKNYLVDVTNCDDGTIGYPDQLFMRGYDDVQTYYYEDGSVAAYAYTYYANGEAIVYDCDASYLMAEELVLSDTDYTPPIPTLEAYAVQDYFEVEYGDTVILQIEATSNTGRIHYQWMKESGDDMIILDADGPELEVTATERVSNYFCDVTDDYGSSVYVNFSVQLDNLHLTKRFPEFDYNYYSSRGETITMILEAESKVGNPPQYQWYDEINGTIMEGETSGTLSIVADELRQYLFKCVITDDFGSEISIYYDFNYDNGLTVNRDNKIAADLGDTVELRVDASWNDGILTYEWYDYVSGWYVEDPELDEKGPTLTVQATEPLHRYYCIVRDEFENTEVASFIVFGAADIHMNETVTATFVESYQRLYFTFTPVVSGTYEISTDLGTVAATVALQTEDGVEIDSYWKSIECDLQAGEHYYIYVIALTNYTDTFPIELKLLSKVEADVVLPADIETIESEAFVNTDIHTVYVPSNVSNIADDAFDSDVVILTEPGSAAQEWFINHGYTVLDAALME